jgi:UDP-N-acetylglucosamine--N-acetylmuramyl-(pentapeptide) pyrophosphoryl-undecaprenol N-acetylglucosamine transferase
MQDKQPNTDILRVMVMAGGTGGHVFPALVVAEKLRAANVTISWLGTRRGIESDLVPARNIDINYLSVEGLRGRGLIALLKAPLMLLISVLQSLKVLAKFKPHVVLGMGGFASGPGALAARLKRIPLIIHEQNSIAGTTNRILSKLATRVMQGFPDTLNRGEWCGNPVRTEIVSIEPPHKRFANRQGRARMLVLGGSRGALALNKLLPEALALVDSEVRPMVLHQTGKAHLQITQDAYNQHGLEVNNQHLEVTSFIDKMEDAYSWADFVICRAGALTITELTSIGLGALLVPFPYAIDDHQTSNGKLLVNCGAAKLVQEGDLSPRALAEHILNFSNAPDRCLSMAAAARSMAKNDAAERVAAVCLEVAHG